VSLRPRFLFMVGSLIPCRARPAGIGDPAVARCSAAMRFISSSQGKMKTRNSQRSAPCSTNSDRRHIVRAGPATRATCGLLSCGLGVRSLLSLTARISFRCLADPMLFILYTFSPQASTVFVLSDRDDIRPVRYYEGLPVESLSSLSHHL